MLVATGQSLVHEHWVLAGGLAGTDCSSTSFAVAKGMCPFLLWLQLPLWAEVFPADTQHIEGLHG